MNYCTVIILLSLSHHILSVFLFPLTQPACLLLVPFSTIPYHILSPNTLCWNNHLDPPNLTAYLINHSNWTGLNKTSPYIQPFTLLMRKVVRKQRCVSSERAGHLSPCPNKPRDPVDVSIAFEQVTRINYQSILTIRNSICPRSLSIERIQLVNKATNVWPSARSNLVDHLSCGVPFFLVWFASKTYIWLVNFGPGITCNDLNICGDMVAETNHSTPVMDMGKHFVLP